MSSISQPKFSSQNLAPTLGKGTFSYDARCWSKSSGERGQDRERWRERRAFPSSGPPPGTHPLLPVRRRFYIGRVMKNIVSEQTRHSNMAGYKESAEERGNCELFSGHIFSAAIYSQIFLIKVHFYGLRTVGDKITARTKYSAVILS